MNSEDPIREIFGMPKIPSVGFGAVVPLVFFVCCSTERWYGGRLLGLCIGQAFDTGSKRLDTGARSRPVEFPPGQPPTSSAPCRASMPTASVLFPGHLARLVHPLFSARRRTTGALVIPEYVELLGLFGAPLLTRKTPSLT